MAQTNDFSIDANLQGLEFRNQANEKLLALATLNGGNTPPVNPQNGMLWFDTANSVLKIRKSSSWLTIGSLGEDFKAADSDKLDGLAAGGYRKSADSYTKVQTDAKILGVDQTWKNLTTQRQAGIIYTNSSSKPIVVSVYIKPQTQGNRLSASLEVSSLIVAFTDITPMNNAPLVSTLTAIIPAAATYRLSANLPLEITRWAELS